MTTIRTINPATGEELACFDALPASEIEQKLVRAAAAAASYRKTSFAERAAHLREAAELLFAERRKFGELMTTEMGKTLKSAVAEAEKCAFACRFYAENAERMLADEPVTMEGGASHIAYEPLGVVLAVMPWNFPFWQVIRFAAPALMAGNVGLLKHASNVPQCALALEELFRRAGVPDCAFQTLLVGSDAVDGIIADPRVSAVTLTGSSGAGRAVGAAAGRALKKSVLELGGSDPFIVMPSADLDRAVETAVTARMINNGQSCIAAKRFIVHRDVMPAFREKFVARVQALKVGDPMQMDTDVGPLATPEILRGLDEQVQKSVAMGAKILAGGNAIVGKGNYYQPTVLDNVPAECPAARDELFGPVAPLFEARNINDAICIANDTPFGLGAAAWSTDEKEHACFMRDVRAGTLITNGMVASDPRMPFGGIKESGYGRELATFGIREFVNVKSVRRLGASAPLHASE